jgi:HupE / UreJ protein
MRRWLAVLLAWPVLGGAHPLAPALLELTETASQHYEVLWRTPVARVRGAELAPELPASCVVLRPARSRVRDGEALESDWAVHCENGLDGQRLSVRGLDGSGIDVVLRLAAADGRVVSALIGARTPYFVVPARASGLRRVADYFTLGCRHLLTGPDHVLFVLGLLLLVGGWRRLLLAITAFTAGHSLTLAAATLGWLPVGSAAAELGIALSLVAVALAILQPGQMPMLARGPAAAALAFGLLHGLGFAGALAQLGLPRGEIPLALLSFNVGIEAGQLLLIGCALGLAALARAARVPAVPALARVAPAYIIGSLAACWCLERAWLLVA